MNTVCLVIIFTVDIQLLCSLLLVYVGDLANFGKVMP